MPKAKKETNASSARMNPLGRESVASMENARSTLAAARDRPNPATKRDCQDGNYLLLIVIKDTQDPTIRRLLSVPPKTAFETLHQALQIAFGWANCHMHEFRVEEKRPTTMGLRRDLLTLQTDPSGDSFVEHITGEKQNMQDDTIVSLAEVFEAERDEANTRIIYEYDMGAGWEHEIFLLGRADAALGSSMGIDQKIVCLAGEGHGCAEDCGGTYGWKTLKALFASPRDEEGRKHWYKTFCSNGDTEGLDPWKWDMLAINKELAKIRANR